MNMCGIAGIARLDRQELGAETDAVLNHLADILDHRGPDERDILRDGGVGLAFTRLALVNPEDGSQPLTSDDGSLVLVVNGEIYNHRELAASLPGGVKLSTGSDCEVLLYLYRHYGLEFLRDVRGMFALILWDRANNKLVLARDRFGIKPLYYHRNDERIVLSSEIKGLFADGSTPRRFDWEQALANPLLAAAGTFNDGPVTTWFEGIELVPAATILRVDLHDGRTSEHRYWELPTDADESADAGDFVRRYSELLQDSVRECVTADTELGLFLSGGIDSSAVLALAGDKRQGMHTFTALTGGTLDNGDADNAAWIARELGVPNHQVVFPQDHVPTPQEWLRLLWLAETPMCGPEVYYKHELHRYAREARPGLRGMLLGAASDEFNGGYAGELGGDWQSFMESLSLMDRDTRIGRRADLRHWWAEGPSFISQQALDGRASDSDGIYRAYLQSEYLQVQQYNVWHEDRTAAGSGVEARVPFLDHRLVELCARIPERLRPTLLWDKRILREAVKLHLPQRIAERPKAPFFYGTGTYHAYRMLARLMRADSYALVERALAAPGASDFIDADRVRAHLALIGEGGTDAPSVELLMRVLNMGLLADLASNPPRLEDTSAGPVLRELARDQISPSASAAGFRAQQLDGKGVPAFAEGLLLLTDPVGSNWYLLKDGEIEFVLEADTPTLAALRAVDGKTSLADILAIEDAGDEEVHGDLCNLLDLGLLTWSD
ncbi:asparagine synthase (glutamine-hydrolyzing) [Streptomyces sp. ISL-10]|uniref:asparagine synthase (glutamine-hydrolyzing) n=1 Tax=Streptomyces sp. ISL-10 TaxID=2819172 RepID=UPI001BEBC5B0|nr:asparagine synthase (glutamine-hydrolyzing) [Streptomyces sp. ISL-10]MBT2363966.1 asparagine synthase (glutamine-hydrolyzing) [Streptomyces sp. ISL-10]